MRSLSRGSQRGSQRTGTRTADRPRRGKRSDRKRETENDDDHNNNITKKDNDDDDNNDITKKDKLRSWERLASGTSVDGRGLKSRMASPVPAKFNASEDEIGHLDQHHAHDEKSPSQRSRAPRRNRKEKWNSALVEAVSNVAVVDQGDKNIVVDPLEAHSVRETASLAQRSSFDVPMTPSKTPENVSSFLWARRRLLKMCLSSPQAEQSELIEAFCQEYKLDNVEDLELLCDHVRLSIGEGVPIRWDLVQELLFPEDQMEALYQDQDDNEDDASTSCELESEDDEFDEETLDDECEVEYTDYYDEDDDSSYTEYAGLEGSLSLAGSDDMEYLPEMCGPISGSAHSRRSYYGSDHTGRYYFDISLHGRSVAESTVTCSVMDADSIDAIFDFSYRSWLSSSDRR
jgi:hypothetical protein